MSREEFPLEDDQKIDSLAESEPVDIFIHCAAYTAVDKAESEKEKAFQVNATATGLIASHLSKSNTRLIYISTDYVFDGTSSAPLTEQAPQIP